MTPSEVGGTTNNAADPILSPDWYKQLKLTSEQLIAYIRHSYIWRHTGNTALDSAAQTKKLVRCDGGVDSFGCRFTAVWPRILKSVIAAEADPGVWVAAHFSPVAVKKYIRGLESFEVRDLSPTQLCGKLSPQIYIEYREYLPQALKLAYETAGRTINLRLKSLAKLSLSKEEQYACVVGDEGYVTATPFFRHGFATLFKSHEAAERYLWPAAFEYEANQRLYAHVADWCVTDNLKQAVTEIRTHWRRI